MGWTKAYQRKQAKTLGSAVAQHFYQMFQVPTNRGVNFNWQEFPRIVADYTAVQIQMSFPQRTIGDDIVWVAVLEARRVANRLSLDLRRGT
jgi:hypothetical protein